MRENGGQYTHAATWFVIALAEMGDADAAWRAFEMLNPVNHALDKEAAERYRTEPYVVAADVYSSPDKGGRGGWTWYTGSAGWLYRAAVESILGMQKEGDRLTIRPVLPHHWDGYSATLQLGGATYRIAVQRGKEGGRPSVKANGVQCEGGAVMLADGGTVDVVVTLGS